MLCLDLIPGPQDGRRRRNHGAIAAAAQRILICSEIISQLPEFARNCSFFWGGGIKCLCDKFFYQKLPQTKSNIFGYFENHLFLCKNGYYYFLGKFWGNFGIFLFYHMVTMFTT